MVYGIPFKKLGLATFGGWGVGDLSFLATSNICHSTISPEEAYLKLSTIQYSTIQPLFIHDNKFKAKSLWGTKQLN